MEHTFAAPKGILALEVRHENYWLVIPGRPLDGCGQNQSRTCCSLIHFTHSLLQPGTAASFLLWGFHEISTPPPSSALVGARGCLWNLDFRGGRTPHRHFDPRKELGSSLSSSKLTILPTPMSSPSGCPLLMGSFLPRAVIGERR